MNGDKRVEYGADFGVQLRKLMELVDFDDTDALTLQLQLDDDVEHLRALLHTAVVALFDVDDLVRSAVVFVSILQGRDEWERES
jgi:hypothetical protein